MDLGTKLLNNIFGRGVNDLRAHTKKRYNEESVKSYTTAGSASLLAGDNEYMDMEAQSASLESSLNKMSNYGSSSAITAQDKAANKSFLGGLAPSEYLKAWKGYVAARTNQVSQSKSNPAQKQTLLTGGI